MICKECRFWVPHHLYPNYGYCFTKEEQLIFGRDEVCDVFVEKRRVEDVDMLWCRLCNMWVTKEEFDEHFDHEVYVKTYEDPEAYVDTYAGD